MSITHAVASAISLFSGLLQRWAEATEGTALVTDEKANLCAISKEPEEYPAYVTEILTSHQQAEIDAISRQLKYEIYIQKHDTELVHKMISVLAAIQEKSKTALAAAAASITKLTMAVASGSLLRGRILEFLELLAETRQKSGAASGCLSQNVGSLINGKANLGDCGQQTTPTSTLGKKKPTKIAAAAFTDLTSGTAGNTKVADGTAKCGLFTTDNTNVVLNSARYADSATYLGGYIKLATNGPGNSTVALNALSTSSIGTPPDFTSAWRDITAASTDPAAEKAAYTPIQAAEVRASAAAKAAYKFAVLKDNRKYKKSVDDAIIEPLIAKDYPDSPEFENTWWKPVNTNSVSKLAYGEDSEEKEELTDSTDIDKLRKALSYYMALRIAEVSAKTKDLSDKLKTAQETTKVITKTVQELCSEKADADTYRQDKNCKYDENIKEGPKCVLSEEGKQAAEKAAIGANTNTTGRNSFVINKAPLFLALLHI
uniref:Variant surface glycoprotein 571 n=1 Tax=Trypanosoma brucei TaxID=5691 RepID=M4SYE6_9TRYP|nr:variant surface glycoprotein 571 [Trypanosoma brucei]